jgi:hypothetical protein
MTSAICSGNTFTVTPVNGVNGTVPAGTTYSWGPPTIQSGITVTLPSSGTNVSNITGTLTSSNTAPRTATYTVTPSLGSCTGVPFTVTVTVNPNPNVAFNISTFQGDHTTTQNICDGMEVLGTNWAQPPANYFANMGYTAQWQMATSSTGPWSPAVGTLTVFYQFVLPNPPNIYSSLGHHYFRLQVSNNYGCSVLNSEPNIDVNRISTLTIEAGGPDNVCQGTVVDLLGAFVGGTPLSGRGGRWSITSGGGSLSNTGFIDNSTTGTTPGPMPTTPIVRYTPAPGYVGQVVLTLTSNDPDGSGPCRPLTDTRIVNIGPVSVTAGGPDNVCSSATPAAIPLTGATSNGAGATWSILSPSGAGTLSTDCQLFRASHFKINRGMFGCIL